MKTIYALALASLFVTGAAVYAGTPQSRDLRVACKKDLKEFGCKPKTELEAYVCLEQHEKSGEKTLGFSDSCHKAHLAFEKKLDRREEAELEKRE